MPFTEAFASTGVLGGLFDGRTRGDGPPGSLPVGFDAVAQFSHKLLQASLGRSLSALGLGSIDIRRPWVGEALPASVHDALSAHVRLSELNTVLGGVSIEFRLTDPVLRTLGERPQESQTASMRVAWPPVNAPGHGAPAEIVWSVELNLLKLRPSMVLTTGSGPTASSSSSPVANFNDFAVGAENAPSEGEGTRIRVGAGRLVTKTAVTMSTRLDLLQAWLDFDLAGSSTALESGDAVITDLLAAAVGQAWFHDAVARLSSAGRVQACPRFALGGMLTSAQVAATDLTDGRADYQIHRTPSGAEILSVTFAFGDAGGGLVADLQPFIGARDFALFVSREAMGPVIRARWSANAASRDITALVPLQMPLSAGSDDIGTGTAQINVQFGDLDAVSLMAAAAPLGDVLRLTGPQTIHVLGMWWPNGDSVGDLGDLGKPTIVPSTLNVAPFADPPDRADTQSEFRRFMLSVLEPMAVPLLDRYAIYSLDGFLSEALDASICRWSLPPLTAGLADINAVGGLLHT